MTLRWTVTSSTDRTLSLSYRRRRLNRFGRITGVDISGEMIQYAKMCHQAYDERLNFKQVDLMNIIQPSQLFPHGFDKILSFYCLHWIKDHR